MLKETRLVIGILAVSAPPIPTTLSAIRRGPLMRARDEQLGQLYETEAKAAFSEMISPR
jgi:hypothetical protein